VQSRYATIADGVLEVKHMQALYANRSTRAWMREYATGYKCTMRPLLVERAHLLQLKRYIPHASPSLRLARGPIVSYTLAD
jgi:hypothetical protein